MMNTTAKNAGLAVVLSGLGPCCDEIDLTQLVSLNKCKGKTIL
jgi:hypothetical protein